MTGWIDPRRDHAVSPVSATGQAFQISGAAEAFFPVGRA
jgi:hypothetical protein